jgi:hypothetical protein
MAPPPPRQATPPPLLAPRTIQNVARLTPSGMVGTHHASGPGGGSSAVSHSTLAQLQPQAMSASASLQQQAAAAMAAYTQAMGLMQQRPITPPAAPSGASAATQHMHQPPESPAGASSSGDEGGDGAKSPRKRNKVNDVHSALASASLRRLLIHSLPRMHARRPPCRARKCWRKP